jgi:hypothetical protein
VKLIKHIGVDDAKLYILTPYPGTELYRKFEREGRLLPGRSRTQFGWSHAVFEPANMTPEELERGVQRAYNRLYVPFLRRVPRAAITCWRMGLKHPRAMSGILTGALRRPHVSR